MILTYPHQDLVLWTTTAEPTNASEVGNLRDDVTCYSEMFKRCFVAHRNPRVEIAARFGHGYADLSESGESSPSLVVPLHFPKP